MRHLKHLLGAGALLALLGGCDLAVTGGGSSAAASGDGTGTVPVADYPERVYWGDTHLHTDNSIDAFGFGVRLGPEEALRFARGEKVTATTGTPAQLDRPLDFLVIADHSDGLGATKRLYDAPRMLIRDQTLLRWHDMMHESPRGSQRAVAELITAAANGTLPAALRDPERQAKATEEIWQDHLRTIDRFNEPGKFTALAGFEYTLMPDGNNLHRVLVFRDGSAKTSQVRPFPGLGGQVDQLWDYMDAYEKKTGGHVLAIPHNSNVSNGLMFELTVPGGGPMTAEYARRRAAHEPVVEATQIKGASEAHKFTPKLRVLVHTPNRDKERHTRRILTLIRQSGYRGYVPNETLSMKRKGYDSFVEIPKMLAELRAAIAATASVTPLVPVK